jgi:tellurite resistance-related uncharacterized protein
MRRSITGLGHDAAGDPFAELSCGHRQHVRHHPPLFSRPWVTTAEGRASMLGTELDCVRCDRAELPEDVVAYRRTPDFDERSIPAGLERAHSTKPGVWGLIRVIEGRLRYVIEATGAATELVAAGPPGTVVPEVLHHVEPLGKVRFYVELLRRP